LIDDHGLVKRAKPDEVTAQWMTLSRQGRSLSSRVILLVFVLVSASTDKKSVP
jgi:hypothetical protein